MTMRVIQPRCHGQKLYSALRPFGSGGQARDGCSKVFFAVTPLYRLVSISSARDSHTEDSTSPVGSWKRSFFSDFSGSETVWMEPGLTEMSSVSTSLYLPARSLSKTCFSLFFTSGSGQYRYSYRPAARMPPRMGPTQ